MNKQLLKEMEEMSQEEVYSAIFKDHLTGAYNRRVFDKTEWRTVAIIDLDSLKYLNDNYGHRTGDEYLIELVQLMRDFFGDDNVFRLAAKGDEFAVTSNLHSYQLAGMLNLARRTFPGFTYGIGYNIADADLHLNEEKERRENCGKRAARGECPPWEVKRICA